jgi:cardiolipin synthase
VKSRWIPGNRIELLENGEAFFPAAFDAIRGAKSEVLLETFILFEDKVGMALKDALVHAARNGAQVDVLVDGFGSSDLTEVYLQELGAAGVRIRSFDPTVRILGQRLNVLRRMHRKLLVVDGGRAFVGGINYSADHLADFGPEAKQDYAVALEGPIVDEIRAFVRATIDGANTGTGGWWRGLRPRRPAAAHARPQVGTAQALFVVRDNHEHRNDIERHYRAAIRTARKRVIIANAYFFPGYRLLRQLRRAARRGVDVQLILQGQPDVPIATMAARLLYGYLQSAGVRIHEYCERPLHGKVAVVDDDWATVGSSNLDPLSLSLNLEANVVLRDAEFVGVLRARLEHLMRHSCTEAPAPERPQLAWWAQLRALVVFHFLRNYTSWANWLPRHSPRLAPLVELPAAAVQAAEPATSVPGADGVR